MVCFIHRPEYYKINEDAKGNSLIGLSEIIIAKHRNGAVGDVRLRFRGELARFQNLKDDTVIPRKSTEKGYRTDSRKAGTIGPNTDFLSQQDDDVPF